MPIVDRVRPAMPSARSRSRHGRTWGSTERPPFAHHRLTREVESWSNHRKVDGLLRESLDGRSYLQATIDELRQHRIAKPGLPFDYLTMNDYGRDLAPLWNAARNALGTDFNTTPLIQAQSGVFVPGEWERNAGTTLEAARSMASLDEALQVPDLQTFTFSGWIPHLIAFQDGTALKMPLFHALTLYARMPDRRVQVQGTLPAGVGVLASGDEHRNSVMVWNETSEPYRIELNLSHLQARPGTELSVFHIDSEHGSPLEHSGTGFSPTETVRLDRPGRPMAKTVTVAGPGIVHVEIGAASRHPVLERDGLAATLVRKHTYADRTNGPDGTISVRGNAYGYSDAVRSIAYLGVDGEAGTALCAAEYRDLPDTVRIDLRTDLPAPYDAPTEALFGVRVDYVLADAAVKSVLFHGDIFDSHRASPLPWGCGGPTADVLVRARELDRRTTGRGRLVLPLAPHAPSGWARAGRQAVISFWMDSTGPASQARFLLE